MGPLQNYTVRVDKTHHLGIRNLGFPVEYGVGGELRFG